MYRIRSVEQKIAKKYSEGKMRCPTHLSIGQEAVSAAFSEIALKNSTIISKAITSNELIKSFTLPRKVHGIIDTFISKERYRYY